MNKNLIIIVCLGIALQLSGCSSNQPQSTAPVEESSVPGAEQPNVVQPELPTPPVTPPTVTPQAQGPAPVLAKNAIASLTTQSRAQYQAKNYQAAIAIAERGLRIDRRAPELYLVLAQSYVQLANTQLAQQFVQQGIRYAQAGSEVAQKLAKIKDSLPR
ncbi:MAG: tetratricopeptide repeat protein [Pseudomonadota bacterium]